MSGDSNAGSVVSGLAGVMFYENEVAFIEGKFCGERRTGADVTKVAKASKEGITADLTECSEVRDGDDIVLGCI